MYLVNDFDLIRLIIGFAFLFCFYTKGVYFIFLYNRAENGFVFIKRIIVLLCQRMKYIMQFIHAKNV